MSDQKVENQINDQPIVELRYNNPNQWELSEQSGLLGFFETLLKIDIRNNPENYKQNPQSDEHINIPNPNNTSQRK
jgi:hypothetical protein